MGVEWKIGCLKCKHHIWLGSQKPFKWKGFQIENENVVRFLSLHSCCNSPLSGNLLLANDGTSNIPWEEENEQSEWQEDILSRTFCFDSWSHEGLICAHCSEKLEANTDRNRNTAQKILKKSQYLWFCNQVCFASYIEFNQKRRDADIYDSSQIILPETAEVCLEIGCTQCKNFVVINHQKDRLGNVKDFEYLALFLSEHVGHDHLLIAAINPSKMLWSDNETHSLWREYEY